MSLTQSEKDKIKKESSEILQKFGKTLSKLKIHHSKIHPNESSGFRSEGNAADPDSDFRQRMFSNAPKTQGDFIIAEKKKW